MFSLFCDVGNEVSQAEPEPRAEVAAILSPFNRGKSQCDSSKSWCGWCCCRPRSRGSLWGRKQLLPLSLSTIIKLIKTVQSRWYLSCASWMSRRCDKCQWDECVVWRETLSMLDTFFFFCFGSSRGAPLRRRQMASLDGGAPSPVPTQWLPAGLAASGPRLVFKGHNLDTMF